MPIYEYACSGCGSRFEKLVRRFAEEVSCPSCASGAVDKQLSVFAVGASSASAAAAAAAAPRPPAAREPAAAGPAACRTSAR